MHRAPLLGSGLIMLALVGCPTSDDVVAIHDEGLQHFDAHLPVDGQSEPDLPGIDVPGTPVDTGSPDIEGGCKTAADCAEILELAACQMAVCDKGTGDCSKADLPDGSPCDDGDACSLTECTAGVCLPTGTVDCDDGVECTADDCNAQIGCLNLATTNLPCEDGDPCTENDTCQSGDCVPGTNTGCAPLGDEENPADSCGHLISASPGTPSGAYYIQPDGAAAPWQVYCELETAGGGWTRVMHADGQVALCALSQPIGDAASLLVAAPSTTVVLPAADVAKVPFTQREVLVTQTGGYFVFRAGNAELDWAKVASGTANSSTVETFQVEGGANGAPLQALINVVPKAGTGAGLLGGKMPNDSLTPRLGIGSYHSPGSFDQATCTSPYKGMYSGADFPPANWNRSGTVYIR